MGGIFYNISNIEIKTNRKNLLLKFPSFNKIKKKIYTIPIQFLLLQNTTDPCYYRQKIYKKR